MELHEEGVAEREEDEAEEGFAEREASAASRDAVALALLLAIVGAVLRRSPEEARAHALYATCLITPVVLICCLCWLRLAPDSWQKWRVLGVACARLAALLPLTLGPGLMLAGPNSPYRLLLRGSGASAEEAGGDGSGGPAGLLYVCFSVVGLALSAIGLQLPPVLSAVLQACSVAAMGATNGAHCSTPYMRHPQSAAYISAAYRWLAEPLIAPLEPLLWLAGIGKAHPQRHCYCVLTALQFWGGLALPLLLVVVGEGVRFRSYRRTRLARLLLRRRREERDSLRYWTRAAAARRRQEAQQRDRRLSDPSSSTSSGPSSPESEADRQSVARQAEALAEGPVPEGLLLPGDWQFEITFQLYLRLRELAGWPALLLVSAQCLLYAWHVLAFP